MNLDFSRCRSVWVPDTQSWSPPPPHVRVGVEWIVNHPYGILADDMGGMKTAQAIISAQFLHDAGVIDRVIVVAPAAVRPKVWFDKDLGQLHEQVFEDKLNRVTEFHQKVKVWSHGPKEAKELRWIITNYEYIRNKTHLNELLPYCGPKTMLILDESSAVRVYDSKQTEACMLLRWKQNKRGRPVLGVPRCGRILELNGTPVAESPMDMFSQANLLHPSVLDCRYVTHYRSRYAVMKTVLGAGGKPLESPYSKRTTQPDGSIKVEKAHIQQIAGWTNLEDLQQRLAPYVLRREAKDLGIDFALPPVGFDVPLTDTTWSHYCDMRDEMVVWLKSGVATASQAGVKAIRLAQICSGFLGGIEDANIGEADLEALLGEAPQCGGTGFISVPPTSAGPPEGEMCPGCPQCEPTRAAPSKTQEVGREKLDFALAWHADLLKRYPDLKLLTWCRFVPELRRYLKEVVETFPNVAVGAACGEKVLDMVPGNQKAEREYALRLLHPKTAPKGAATVGATQGVGAIGLNMTACRTVLDMSYDFSPWKKKQGDARVNRPGQTGPVSFFYLVATGPKGQRTIDHHIMTTRLGKTNINDWTTAAWVRALMEE